MESQFKIGRSVKRILPKGDYTFGRKGEIVEISPDGKRIRVRWIYNSDGSFLVTSNAKPGNGVRTWVAATNIELI